MSPTLVTGGAGQLATALAEQGGAAVRVVGRPGFDFDRPETIDRTFAETRPTLVVNAAAWTAVDAAEKEPEAAMRANRDGPARLARLCAEAGATLIHVSTDYVFDGRKGAPYVETDPTGPTGVYGATKLAGEQAVIDACPRAIVLRTSWVYSATGKNFLRTMLNLAQTRDHLRVVADQKGCPTAARDLARVILGVAARLADGWRDEYGGVFHSAGSGWTTWHGFAEAIFEESARRGGRRPVVEAITTAEYPTPAQRPADSRLDCGKIERVFGLRQPPWRDSLAHTVDALLATARVRE
ncbi:MAG TPA: dTDP-4-dehydrorhamnose reductase [Acetobacteraceae bacterium]|jgi:dTDP-4-dehydrorhamnose reductase|nr:dTDP-4-dehydrorhamnose reductase [Acetobacteraceae bacterium]